MARPMTSDELTRLRKPKLRYELSAEEMLRDTTLVVTLTGARKVRVRVRLGKWIVLLGSAIAQFGAWIIGIKIRFDWE